MVAEPAWLEADVPYTAKVVSIWIAQVSVTKYLANKISLNFDARTPREPREGDEGKCEMDETVTMPSLINPGYPGALASKSYVI